MADPLVLALDTSILVNVGLARGGQVLASAHHRGPDGPCRAADADGAGTVSVRPGSAWPTSPRSSSAWVPARSPGLRVGVVTAQVLANVRGIELRGVCSLDVLAAQFADTSPAGEFVVATDARRREVYWAGYTPDGRRTTGPAVSAPSDVPRRPTVGPAVDLYPDQLLAAPGPRALDPGLLAVRGPGLPDVGREPLYLRRPDATEPTRRKSVLGAR